MNVHFVIHESFEAPGALEDWARSRALGISSSRMYRGEPLPVTLEEIDLLVVMGGPQSPETTLEECAHFDSAAEQRLILDAVTQKKMVLGVCLGAQMIGQALGAPVERSPEKEIGAFPIVMTPAGRADPRFAHFGATEIVGHWHGDMPGLTQDAKVLALSEGCPRQIVRFADRVYGFQCHLELTPTVVEALIAASEADLGERPRRRFVQSPEELRAMPFGAMNDLLFRFLDALISAS